MNTDDYNGMEGPCKAGWVIWPMLVYATIGAGLALTAWYLLPSMIVTKAFAQPVCIPVNVMKEQMEKTYHEFPVASGVTTKGNAVVQIYASADGKTFTVVIIGTNGIACGVAAGTDWQQNDVPKAEGRS